MEKNVFCKGFSVIDGGFRNVTSPFQATSENCKLQLSLDKKKCLPRPLNPFGADTEIYPPSQQ
jgi:hypothetical protein